MENKAIPCTVEGCKSSFKYRYNLNKHLIKVHKINRKFEAGGKFKYSSVKNNSNSTAPSKVLIAEELSPFERAVELAISTKKAINNDYTNIYHLYVKTPFPSNVDVVTSFYTIKSLDSPYYHQIISIKDNERFNSLTIDGTRAKIQNWIEVVYIIGLSLSLPSNIKDNYYYQVLFNDEYSKVRRREEEKNNISIFNLIARNF